MDAMTKRDSWQRRWAQKWAGALSFVADLFVLHSEPVRYLDDEVRGLVNPCLPLLMRKHSKFFASAERRATERWRSELDFFVDRILWPMLAVSNDPDGRVRARVVSQIDTLVRSAARDRAALACSPEPLAWRSGETG